MPLDGTLPSVQQDLKVLAALKLILLDAQTIDGATITPQTTLAAPPGVTDPAAPANQVGDTSVWVADPTVYNPGGPFDFYDSLGERFLLIDADWNRANPVLLTFAGLPHAGLQYAHAQGARVGANLFSFTPMHLTNMLDQGDAVVYVDSDAESGMVATPDQNEPNFTCALTARVSLLQTIKGGHDQEFMDPNQWAEQQRAKTRKIVEAARAQLQSRWTLVQDGVAYRSMGFGQRGNPNAPVFSKQWREVYVAGQGGNLTYQGRATFPVRGIWTPIDFRG